MKKLVLIMLACLLATTLWAQVPERRKEQFSTDEGWYLFPVPFDAPGLGSGLIVAGLWNNIGGSHTDLGASHLISGDFDATGLALFDLHLIEEHLIADFGGGIIRRAIVTSYQGRGFDSDPDDVFTYQVGDGDGAGARLTLTFWDRRANFFASWFSQSSRLEAVYDADGKLIYRPEDAAKEAVGMQRAGFIFDLTDNWYDPRKGLRLSQNQSGFIGLGDDGISPEQTTIDRNVTLYIPIGNQSTWLFNAFDSKAVVTRKGLTDRTELRQQLFGEVDCTLTEDEQACEDVIDKQLDDTVAANRYGTASGLGGISRLRAFPQGRFKGALTRFFGSEIRWNLTDEEAPFNLYLVKDIRTSMQVAFFYETATIGETEAELGKKWRSSRGVGFRLVTGSGLVFRIEAAHGEEGFSQLVFFDYPWSDAAF